MSVYVDKDCAAGNRRDIRIIVSERDVFVCHQRPKSRWREPIARLRPNAAVDLATEILRRFAPNKLVGE
ncbi:MAG: hypothetical protein JSV86_10435 [Gemmatimonadota bacterium]|nr:MAG: hypothetical protein JSV86_10435 [Gemmatimonadota bacterium]